MQTSAPSLERTNYWPFVGAWLMTATILVIAAWPAPGGLVFPDPDDALRLQQVRDWLGGQSWFDVTQYRLNPPDGAPMHWSRLVDVPIAAAILLLTPLLGQHLGELVAMVIVPLLTLAVVMALVAKLSWRLLDRDHALLATLLVPVSVAALHQLRPFRIDHHGWQMALALVAVIAALDRRPLRSGLVAGTAAALWLQISLEGLPFAIALVALYGLRWLIDPREGGRLVALLGALSGGSLVLVALTKSPADWSAIHCDVIAPAYIPALGVAALGMAAVVAARIHRLPVRLAAAGFVAVLMIAAIRIAAPQCSAGPFEALDPVVRRFWYDRVNEGLPLWHQPPAVVAIVVAFPLVGLWGSLKAWAADPARRQLWTVFLFLLVAAILAAVFVQRSGALANLLALPGGVFLMQRMLARARTKPPLARLAGMLGALLLATPSYAFVAIDATIAGMISDVDDYQLVQDCVNERAIGALDALPAARVAAPLDIAPAIVAFTHHSTIASGHHRNGIAMRHVIDIFGGRYDRARGLLAMRGAQYVAVCPELIEPWLYRQRNPDGLVARLYDGRTPQWLTPVPLKGTPLRVWRVEQPPR